MTTQAVAQPGSKESKEIGGGGQTWTDRRGRASSLNLEGLRLKPRGGWASALRGLQWDTCPPTSRRWAARPEPMLLRRDREADRPERWGGIQALGEAPASCTPAHS